MLKESRIKIDQLDKTTLQLLVRRLKICKRIGEYKKKHHLPIQNRKREKQIIKERVEQFKYLGLDDEKFIKELFELIMRKSRRIQQEQK